VETLQPSNVRTYTVLYGHRHDFSHMLIATCRTYSVELSVRYAYYLHELGNSATVILIAHTSSIGNVSTTCADIYSSKNGLFMQLLVQLLLFKPSGLFQFINNHWTINHLNIWCDSSQEISAQCMASP